MSSIIEYRKEVLAKIETLSESRLKSVLDFVGYLADKEEWDATLEILSNADAVKNIKDADEAWKDKRNEEFSPWEAVRRDV